MYFRVRDMITTDNVTASAPDKAILLADPPYVLENQYAAASPNLGLLYLAAVLRKEFKNLQIHYVDGCLSIREHLFLVQHIKPAIYALSFASLYAGVAMELINSVKRVCPYSLVVCGGPHPTADPCDVLATCHADICCIGEGDVTFVEIVRAMLSGEDARAVAGIAWRDSEGHPRLNPRRSLVANLDDLPFPSWDLIDPSKYSGERKTRGKLSMAIIASRGCPHDCTFCSNPVWRNQKPWFRKRSPHKIAEEVDALYARGIREIYIRSDEMNADVDWATSVFNSLHQLKHPDLFFQCNLRATSVPSKLATAMAKANCWLCHIGIESSSQRVLDGIQKGITLSEVEDTLQILKQSGIKTYGFFTCYQAWEEGNELQVETTKEVLSSLRYAVELRWRGLLDHFGWALARPYPGSHLYQTCSKYNLFRYPPHVLSVMSGSIATRLPGITRMEMATAHALGFMIQGILFLLDSDSYSNGNMAKNLKHVVHKLRVMAELG
jgi:hypothetical protein